MAKHRRGKTPEDYAAALRVTGGLIAPAARRLGVSRAAVYNMASRHPSVREVLDDARGELLDLAESRLISAVNRGNLHACMYLLDRLGRDRGYGKTVRFKARGPSAQELAGMGDNELEQLGRELRLS